MNNLTKPSSAQYIFSLLVLTGFMFFASGNLMAQKTEKLIQNGDKHFLNGRYDEALEAYQKAEKKTGYREDLFLNMARSYEKMGNYSGSESCYGKIVTNSNRVDPGIFIEYAMVLMKLGKNEEARNYFMSYNNLLEDSDIKALKYIESIEDYDRYYRDSTFMQVSLMKASSDGNELNPVLNSGRLYFRSNRKYKASTPLETDVYYASDRLDAASVSRIKNPGNVKGRLDGFAIAEETGEFLFVIYDYETKKSGIYRAFISDHGDEISKPEKVELGSFSGNIESLTVNHDGSMLIFSSGSTSDQHGAELYRCQRNSYGYSDPTRIEGFVNSMGNEKDPVLVNDTLLFFSSDGHGGLGGMDIFYLDLNRPTAFPVNPGYPLNSRFDEEGIALSENGNYGYFISDRSDGNRKKNLYSFTCGKIRAWGEITDKESGQNLKNVAIDVKKKGEGGSQFMLADNGRFSIVGDPGDSYQLTIWSEGYELESFYIDTENSRSMGLFDVNMGRFPILKTGAEGETPELFRYDEEPLTADNQTVYKPEPEPVLQPETVFTSQEEPVHEAEAAPAYEPEIEYEPEPEPVTEPETMMVAEPEPEPVTETEPEQEPVTEVEQEPVNEPEPAYRPEPAFTVASDDQIVFRVQIAASRSKISDSELKKLYTGDQDVFMFEEDNWYKYAIGEFNSYYEANQFRRKSGAKSSFIAAYDKGIKMNLMSAIKLVHAPEMPAQAPAKGEDVLDKVSIHYPLDGFEPLKGEMPKLDQLLNRLAGDPGLRVRIEGYADMRGSDVYNAGLANERALYIKGYLVTKGISEYRISIAGYGESHLKVECDENCTNSTHMENRRSEIILYK
ncbi:MAG: OmpA family protein [Bacteroidales bacterium]|nr:OmpA family protein [Bacteroidales bacterium]